MTRFSSAIRHPPSAVLLLPTASFLLPLRVRRQLRAIAATRDEALAIVEEDRVLAIRLPTELAHAIEIDNARAAHADELQRVEPTRERRQRLAHCVPHALRTHADVVARRLDPLDLADRHERDAPARPDGEPTVTTAR